MGAKIVMGVVVLVREDDAAAMESWWKPRAERMVARSHCVGGGGGGEGNGKERREANEEAAVEEEKSVRVVRVVRSWRVVGMVVFRVFFFEGGREGMRGWGLLYVVEVKIFKTE